MAEYDPQTIELKWEKAWEEQHLFEARPDPSRRKYYLLEMLPYPSGVLHMGHVRNYSIGDAVARFKRSSGFNVLHPIGWDSFGLPAENAAIQNKVHPRAWTAANISHMRSQCQRFGFSYDWEREISSCEPEYYRWNQWFFLRMLERGLAYRKRSRVNWCPQCHTVLANEQVVDGCCWRHEETPVEQKELEQWFLKIMAYADQLLEDSKQLEGGWPERVLTMQRHWIGKSHGARVHFKIAKSEDIVEVFTTRIDTIYGANAVVLAPEHPMVERLLAGVAGAARMMQQVERMRQQAGRAAITGDFEKEGLFTGKFTANPFSGDLLPLWIGNFVLMEYGTGAVMSVPGHDQRDFEFAKKYHLPVRLVVQPMDGVLNAETMQQAFEAYGRTVNSGPYSGLPSERAIARMTADAVARGFAKAETIYRLKDWGISRQRYWGTPIPVIYCGECGVVPVPDKDLPVLLPEVVEITGSGHSPLAESQEFVNVACPNCRRPAKRETDTMDTFFDSSWYFYRYTDAKISTAPVNRDAVSYWFPIDQYIGGIEHAILHLIYARFFTKVMRDLGLIRLDEPVSRLFSQGMVLHKGVKMSKSRGNVVDPDDMVKQYGADTTRLYVLFAAPPEKEFEWSEQGIEGAHRFLHRLFRIVAKHAPALRQVTADDPSTLVTERISARERKLLRKAHQTIRRISRDFEGRWHFNTSIAAIMELVNELYAAEPLDHEIAPGILKQVMDITAILISPFAPHLGEELWEMLGHAGGLAAVPWPKHDAELAQEEQFEIVIQINGRLRGKILVPGDLAEDELIERALNDPRISRLMEGRRPLKTIVVPNKLVNMVLA